MKKRRILIIVFLILLVLQLFQIDKVPKERPKSVAFIQLENQPKVVAKGFMEACFNCHSNTTRYPWYSYIQPVGWWLRSHVRGGRMHMNFSEWDQYDDTKRRDVLRECRDEIEAGNMPLKSFTWLHPRARLTDAQRAALINWIDNY